MQTISIPSSYCFIYLRASVNLFQCTQWLHMKQIWRWTGSVSIDYWYLFWIWLLFMSQFITTIIIALNTWNKARYRYLFVYNSTLWQFSCHIMVSKHEHKHIQMRTFSRMNLLRFASISCFDINQKKSFIGIEGGWGWFLWGKNTCFFLNGFSFEKY